MAKNKRKTIILNTLLLIFCCVIVGLYCLNPIKDDILKTHLMSFDSEGGTAIQALEFPECSTLEEPANPTREGYIFKGWTLDGEPFDFSQEVCGDIELKAVWEEQKPEVKYITIYFSNGDGSENSPVVIEEGTIPTKPSDPTRENYKFLGWTLNGQPYNFDSPVQDGAVITATWEEIKKEEPEKPEEPEDENQEFTVKFNLNGGKAGGTCTDQKVKKNGVAQNVCKPTRDGYTLSGWSPSINTKITKNLTFVAQWKKNSNPGGGGGTTPGSDTTIYTIRFTTGVSTTCPNVTGTTSTPAFRLNTKCSPTRKYYDLTGWTYGNQTYATNYLYKISGNATLAAQWNAHTFKVTCPKNDDYGTDCTIHVKDGNTNITSGTVIIKISSSRTKTVNIGANDVDVNYYEKALGFTVSVPEGTFNGTK